jgi:hypothetical protein
VALGVSVVGGGKPATWNVTTVPGVGGYVKKIASRPDAEIIVFLFGKDDSH